MQSHQILKDTKVGLKTAIWQRVTVMNNNKLSAIYSTPYCEADVDGVRM